MLVSLNGTKQAQSQQKDQKPSLVQPTVDVTSGQKVVISPRAVEKVKGGYTQTPNGTKQDRNNGHKQNNSNRNQRQINDTPLHKYEQKITVNQIDLGRGKNGAFNNRQHQQQQQQNNSRRGSSADQLSRETRGVKETPSSGSVNDISASSVGSVAKGGGVASRLMSHAFKGIGQSNVAPHSGRK
jgi:hypothetical protein